MIKLDLTPDFFFIAGVIQFGLILSGIFAIIICQIYIFLKKRREKKIETELNHLFNQASLDQKSLNVADIPPNCRHVEILLKILEAYNKRYTDNNWEITKFNLVEGFLKPKTKKWVASHSWFKRSIATRCIYLNPKPQDEAAIEALLYDSSYFIRMLAAFAAIGLKKPSLTYAVLKRMGKESKHARYAYRSAILHSDANTFDQLIKIYQEDPEIEVRLACLDVFFFRVVPNLYNSLVPDLKSENHEIRFAATRLLANLPDPRAITTLETYLGDSRWEIRAEAAKNLGHLHSKRSIKKLEKALSDPVWAVRLQAGLALKQLGEEGRRILETQDWDMNIDAYEIARFLLTTPQG